MQVPLKENQKLCYITYFRGSVTELISMAQLLAVTRSFLLRNGIRNTCCCIFIHSLVEFVLVSQMDREPVQKLFYMFKYLPILSLWGGKKNAIYGDKKQCFVTAGLQMHRQGRKGRGLSATFVLTQL